jgi:tRNA dimethylallyltransferase
VCAFLAGQYNLDEAIRLVKRNTRHYAKRQLTWFGRESGIFWLEYPERFATIQTIVIDFYS